MDEKLKTMYEVCEILSESLKEAKDKLRKSSGPVSVGDADYIDKLTHSIKSLETTIAMKEAGEEHGNSFRNSNRYMPYYGGMSYDSRESYARRGNNPMGRNQYSREGGYSYAEDMEQTKDEIRELSQKMPEEHRRKIERALDDLR